MFARAATSFSSFSTKLCANCRAKQRGLLILQAGKSHCPPPFILAFFSSATVSLANWPAFAQTKARADIEMNSPG